MMQLKIWELDGDAVATIYNGDFTSAKSLIEIALSLSYMSDEDHVPDEAEREDLKTASMILQWLATNAKRPIIEHIIIDEFEEYDEDEPTPPASPAG